MNAYEEDKEEEQERKREREGDLSDQWSETEKKRGREQTGRMKRERKREKYTKEKGKRFSSEETGRQSDDVRMYEWSTICRITSERDIVPLVETTRCLPGISTECVHRVLVVGKRRAYARTHSVSVCESPLALISRNNRNCTEPLVLFIQRELSLIRHTHIAIYNNPRNNR